MIQVRRQLTIGEGVTVDLLVTPHLAVYEEPAGIPKYVPEDAGTTRVMERYADLMYLAAINAWELDGHGTLEDFPHKRGDFHALMQADPKEFGRAVRFVMLALIGKTEAELSAEEQKRRESEKEAAKKGNDAAGPEKKKRTWLYRITHR